MFMKPIKFISVLLVSLFAFKSFATEKTEPKQFDQPIPIDFRDRSDKSDKTKKPRIPSRQIIECWYDSTLIKEEIYEYN